MDSPPSTFHPRKCIHPSSILFVDTGSSTRLPLVGRSSPSPDCPAEFPHVPSRGKQHTVAFYQHSTDPSRSSNNMLLHPSPSFLIFPSLLSRVSFVHAKGISLFLGLPRISWGSFNARESLFLSYTRRSILFRLIRLRLYQVSCWSESRRMVEQLGFVLSWLRI